MKTVVVTGSQGFIGSYVCADLLAQGYKVIGIDDYSKYGYVKRTHDEHENFTLSVWDLTESFPKIEEKVDFIIAGAAMIGGISYFHKYAYDLLANNERIIANTYDFAKSSSVERVMVISSSMVYENCFSYPSKEDATVTCGPPSSSYGFQKLATEYFAMAAKEQYGIDYTIIRPFNCVGVGEEEALGAEYSESGNIKLMLSHVLPDLVNKVSRGQNPVRILGSGDQVRCYTNGTDIARGIRLAMESDKTLGQSYNISTPTQTTVMELLEMVWSKLGEGELVIEHDEPFAYDVQMRVPDVSKAKEDFGFTANITLEESVDEVISWMMQHES